MSETLPAAIPEAAAAAAPAAAPAASRFFTKMTDDSLAQLLALVWSGALRPLRGTFVLELSKAGKRLNRRQELPEHAFWTIDQFGALYEALRSRFSVEESERRLAMLFVGVAWRWATAEHPDPDGKQLRALAQMTQAYLGVGAGSASSGGATPQPQPPPISSWRTATVRAHAHAHAHACRARGGMPSKPASRGVCRRPLCRAAAMPCRTHRTRRL